ncbi:sugar ABC transporter ATP-binding protein [Microbaculum marinum]|uniref:Sugar ABC transporter ATP-binding protein n=1 Tax=Microbaculum marinum TaxID=1764581 RepID=A0AAW9RT04_9HYPH
MNEVANATKTARPPAAPSGDQSPLLEMQGISKGFPGVQALDAVDFDLRRGEVHVLFGENGAGKSTLINVIAGTFPPDAGAFRFEGREVRGLTPHQARVMGISPVFQEFSLVPDMTIEENLFLGREITTGGVLNSRSMMRRAREVIDELGFHLDPKKKVRELSRAHQQMTEIAKALMGNVRLLILDEPTASLTEAETVRLFGLIDRLKHENVGIIYVSHRMREIKQLADRITVLRDGRLIETLDADGVSENELVELMTGRKIDVLFPAIEHKPGETLLNVVDLTLADRSVEGVDFHARAGEITGVAGLVGCGKSELIRAIYGLDDIEAGRIEIDGASYAHPTPARSLKRGICYFPSDRVVEGLALNRPIRENASMAALDLAQFARLRVLQRASERRAIQEIVDKLRLRPPNIERIVANLSGGNRQKVMLARGLTRETTLFLFDEPTVGIDVGAKIEVYELMKQLVEAGAAIVLVSSELPEVLNLSNRLYVMHRGRMVAELTGDDINEQAVLSSFFQDEREVESA